MKIGQIVTFKENMPIETSVGGNVKLVRKGDKGFIDKLGRIHIINGESKGYILCDRGNTKEKIEGYATDDISRLIFSKLNAEFNIKDILYENDIDIDDFKDVIYDILIDIF